MPLIHRTLRRTRANARRRHRTWMMSMSLASLAWGCWWLDLVLMRFVPDVVPSFALMATLASLIAVVGVGVGLFSLRGRNAVWLGIAMIPILANASLLALPYLIDPEVWRTATG